MRRSRAAAALAAAFVTCHAARPADGETPPAGATDATSSTFPSTLHASLASDFRAAVAPVPAAPIAPRLTFAVRADSAPVPFLRSSLRAVVDARIHWLGRMRPDERAVLDGAGPLDPFRVDADAAFAEVEPLLDGRVRLRAGRQTVRWGGGLFVNPTSVVSPPDLEDPLRFGSPTGNEMLRAEVDLGSVRLDAIAVPRFRPALLPSLDARQLLRAGLAGGGVDGDLAEAARAIADDPSYSIRLAANHDLPASTPANAQAAARLSTSVPALRVDLAAVAYHGRTPLPQLATADVTVDLAARALDAELTLVHPRISVFGGEAVGEIPLGRSGAVGWWAEGVWVDPVPIRRRILVASLPDDGVAFERSYPRAAAGLERHGAAGSYVSLQAVHGLFDEFGADAQGNYAVAVVERPLFRERLRLRLLAVHALDDGSRLLAPEAGWSNDHLSLRAGLLLPQGTDRTTFGTPATPSLAYVKVESHL